VINISIQERLIFLVGQTSGNTQTVNVYSNSGQATPTTDISDSKVKSTVETVAGTAISAATELGAGKTAGIAAGVTTGIFALGGGISNSKKIGQALKNTFSGNKLGGKATRSKLVEEDGKVASSSIVKEEREHVRGTKPGKNGNIPSEQDP
jgi:hypothetical protein